MRIAAKTLTALAATVVVGASTAVPAEAAVGKCSWPKVSISGGSGCYVAHGDYVKVHDSGWDGDGIRVKIQYYGGGHERTCVNAKGSDTTKVCNYDYKENRDLVFKVQRIDNGEVLEDSNWYGVTS